MILTGIIFAVASIFIKWTIMGALGALIIGQLLRAAGWR